MDAVQLLREHHIHITDLRLEMLEILTESKAASNVLLELLQYRQTKRPSIAIWSFLSKVGL